MGLTWNKLLLATHLEAITAYKTATQERLPPLFSFCHRRLKNKRDVWERARGELDRRAQAQTKRLLGLQASNTESNLRLSEQIEKTGMEEKKGIW